MTAAQRLELIRTRLGRVTNNAIHPRGMHVAATGAPSAVKPNAKLPPSGGYWRGKGFGQMKGRTLGPKNATWLRHEPEQAEEKPLGERNRTEVSPLTRIAEKLKRSWHR